MKVFEKQIRIYMNHCDPAGIVYHPQYLVLLNNVMEDFFREALQLSYDTSLREGLVGFPIANVHCDFINPSLLGDLCTVKLWVERIGRSSVRFAMTVAGQEGNLRLRCTETTVCVRKTGKTMQSEEIPQALRERLSVYAQAPDAPVMTFR